MAQSYDVQDFVNHGARISDLSAFLARNDDRANSWHRATARRSWTCSEFHPTLQDAATARLRALPGVEAAFFADEAEADDRRIIVVAREHGVIDRETLLDIEEDLAREFGSIEICVRAHQGRGPDIFAGPLRLF